MLLYAQHSPGESKIVCPLKSDDTDAASDVLGRIGTRVVPGEDCWLLTGGRFRAPNSDLDCRESAATLRFMTAIAAAIPGESRLKASPSLALRPIDPLLDSLRQIGVDCHRDAG